MMGFLQEFDGGIFSYEVQSIKPEEKIYRLLLERYRIRPERAVFFDDRPVNVRRLQGSVSGASCLNRTWRTTCWTSEMPMTEKTQ